MINTTKFLQNHRSVHCYLDRPMPQEVLDNIQECGIRASNTGNMQLYSSVVPCSATGFVSTRSDMRYHNLTHDSCDKHIPYFQHLASISTLRQPKTTTNQIL